MRAFPALADIRILSDGAPDSDLVALERSLPGVSVFRGISSERKKALFGAQKALAKRGVVLPLSRLGGLESLVLPDISDHEAESLVALSGLRRLTLTGLSVPPEALALKLEEWNSLEELRFVGDGVPEETLSRLQSLLGDVRVIRSLDDNRRRRILSLQRRLHDRGLPYTFSRLRHLEMFDANYGDFQPEGLSSLEGLKVLSLSGDLANMPEVLRELPSLREVRFVGPAPDERTLASWQSSYPERRFLRLPAPELKQRLLAAQSFLAERGVSLSLSRLAHLEALDLPGSLAPGDLGSLSVFGELRVFSHGISGSDPDPGKWAEFYRQFEHLRELRLRGDGVTEKFLALLEQKLPNVSASSEIGQERRLRLLRLQKSLASRGRFHTLDRLSKTETLDPGRSVSAADLEDLSVLTKLHTLTLDDPPLDKKGRLPAGWIAALKALPSLRELQIRLSEARQYSRAMEQLEAELPEAYVVRLFSPELSQELRRALNFLRQEGKDRHPETNEPYTLFREIRNTPFGLLELEELTLHRRLVTDEDLGKIRGLRGLRRLSVEKRKCSDEDSEEALQCRLARVTKSGVCELTALSKLEELRLDGYDNLSYDDLACLRELPNLRTLSVRGSQVRGASLSRLRRLLPKVKVETE